MSLTQEIKSILTSNVQVTMRPSETYLATTGAYNVFNVIGGAVELLSLGGIITAAGVGATTIRLTVNGINADAAAVNISAGADGEVWYSSLNVAGTLLIAAAVPITVATITTMICGGQAAGAQGIIIATFATATSVTTQMWCAYRALSPGATVQVA